VTGRTRCPTRSGKTPPGTTTPDAFLEMFPDYTEGLHRMKVGDEIIVITWLHRARREVLKVHPIVRTRWGSIA